MKIGVLLAGSGYLDGAEIRESVLTLLSLSKFSAEVVIMAPNIDQHHVVNHLTGEETMESRNVLTESARIARGEVLSIDKVDPAQLDALILPGGFGVAKNLSNLAFSGPSAEMLEEVKDLILSIHNANKPIGAICIAPAVINLIIPCSVTIGSDEQTSELITKLGGKHVTTQATEICIDEDKKIVSTPAYMLNASLYDISIGIENCVKKVIEMI